jgi:hypothetical protein
MVIPREIDRCMDELCVAESMLRIYFKVKMSFVSISSDDMHGTSHVVDMNVRSIVKMIDAFDETPSDTLTFHHRYTLSTHKGY